VQNVVWTIAVVAEDAVGEVVMMIGYAEVVDRDWSAGDCLFNSNDSWACHSVRKARLFVLLWQL
jgi:hypothetical protein